MNDVSQRVFCPQCGAARICHAGSRFAVCPNGHGRLVPRFTKAQLRKAVAASLPIARRVGRRRFTIDGHDGLYVYRAGAGRRRSDPGEPTAPDEVIARHVTRTRQLVRVFARKPPKRTTGDRQDGNS